MAIHKIEVEVKKAINIGSLEELEKLGVDVSRYGERTYDRTQQIGDAANFLEYDALFVPSARWDCNNLVLFVANHSTDLNLQVVESDEVNWDEWLAEHHL